MSNNKNPSAFKLVTDKLGPGILFAAASIGTSHLVQSTRAGAEYGLAMGGIILIACLVRYPAFRFGADYAAATGESLIDNYFKQGYWAVAIFVLELLVNMFIATSAVALVTGGIFSHITDSELNTTTIASLLLIVGSIVLISGKYHLLEGITKILVATFSVIIVIASVLTVPNLQFEVTDLLPIIDTDTKTILFIIALAGWMPTAMGASTFQSLWVCAKSKVLGRQITVREARFDFNIGYIATVLIALCFLLLGTVMMGQQGISVAGSSAAFSGQVITLFTASIGQWVYPIIAIAVLSIMLSTVLTLMDACPRALSIIFNYEKPTKNKQGHKGNQKHYSFFVIFQTISCIIILNFFTGSFKDFIDLATSVAFLVAPFLSFLNHRAVFSSNVPKHLQPSQLTKYWSISGIIIMSGFAIFYIIVIFLT